MKKLGLFAVVLLIAFSMNAQNSNVENEDGGTHFSVAGTDDFMAAKTNPAALGVGNAGGISLIGNYNENGFFEDWYSVIIADDNFAYVLDRIGSNNYHRLAVATGKTDLLPNLYFGSSWDWKNKYFKKGDFSESILYRPADFVSLGAIGCNLFDEDRFYNLGIALRPLIFDTSWLDRLTFSADAKLQDEEWEKPVVGMQTELVNGLKLGASYDLENEKIGVNFGITLDKISLGTFGKANDDNEFKTGQYYVNFSDKSFRSLINFNKNQFVDYKMKGQILETKQAQKIGPFTVVMSKGRTLQSVIDEINKMKDDADVKGIVFINENFKASFAARQELIDCFLDFKKAGKKIVFYFEGTSGSNYAFAAAIADQIYLNPVGYIEFQGLSVSSPYLHTLLDTLGIDVVNLRSHAYKTAGNMFSEDHMTPEERESYEYLLEGIFAEIELMVDGGRGDRLSKPIRELIDETPIWDADVALKNGLIDGVIYEDELEQKLEDLYQSKKITEKYENEIFNYDWSEPAQEKIAVIYAVGYIHSGKGMPGRSIGSITTSEAIKKAREDKSVKGIILRVDSGGGSALASDIIAREVQLCNEGKNKKPVVVSMGGVAASGGYYISIYADKIVCQPGTITGSIGVVGIMPFFERMFDKIHINWDTVKIGKYSDYARMSRLPTEEETKIGELMISNFYDKFIQHVAEGRDMDVKEVHKVAQGRVWTGKQALDCGLVDALGGMNVAVVEMQKLMKTDKKLRLVEYNDSDKTMKLEFPIDASTYIPEQLQTVWKISETVKQFDDDNIQMILPYVPEIK
ncbi:MAG: signal peptide peptidase SppA [Candidatus Cloacimonadales bacterium]|nr:signal peptide peptidase SppA [Candidatus Cloacimonadales bacterium]